jgi:protein TonB
LKDGESDKKLAAGKETNVMERNKSTEPRPRIITGGNRVFRILSVGALVLLSLILVSAIAAQEYDASEVDTMPKIIRQANVTYPTAAKRSNVEGKVVIRVLIGTNGKAEKMEIAESEPEGIFDEAALKSLKYWQFRPGIKNGELVSTWVKIPLSFKLD